MVTVILSSALVAAIVSFVSNYVIQNLNYKQEYHKQLISKRLKAYEAVENVLQILGGHAITENQESIPRVFWERESYIDFMQRLIYAITQSVWLSHDVTTILENINATCTKASFDFNLAKPESSKIDFVKAGLALDSKLLEYKSELFVQIRHDFLKLHNIEAFNKI